MNKSSILIPVFAVILLIMSSCGGTGKKPKEFVSQEGKFSINLYNTPVITNQEVPSEVGTIKVVIVQDDKVKGMVYMVAYSDYPEELIAEVDPMIILEGAKGGVLEKFEVVGAVSEEKINFNGNPGIYFAAKSSQYNLIYKIIMVKNRMYQIGIVKENGEVPAEEKTKIMDSFKLL